MRILVVDHNRSERDATLRLVPAEMHEVKTAHDAPTALHMMEASRFDVVVLESTMTGVSGSELVKRIRARESSEHAYIIVSAARPVPGDVKNAFVAGADDFIRKPIARDELLARIEGPVRIRRWAAKALAAGASSDFGAQSELTSITAWTTADTAVCSELSDMLGLSLSPAPANDALDGCVNVAMLPLSLTSETTEVCLAVGIDESSAGALAETMFGAPPEAEMIKDMMREIANVAAGVIKRLAASEGRAFTTGLPAETTASAFRNPAALARRTWIGTPEGSPLCLRFELELRMRAPRLVRVSNLKEGMVVAKDLHSANGALLMRAGTRITESHVSGLVKNLGHESPVEVLAAA